MKLEKLYIALQNIYSLIYTNMRKTTLNWIHEVSGNKFAICQLDEYVRVILEAMFGDDVSLTFRQLYWTQSVY